MKSNNQRVPSEWEDIDKALRKTEQDFIEEIRRERAFEVLDSVRLALSNATMVERLRASRSPIGVKLDHDSFNVLWGMVTWTTQNYFSLANNLCETLCNLSHVAAFQNVGKHLHEDFAPTLLESDQLWFSDLIEAKHQARWFLHPGTVLHGSCTGYGVDWIEMVSSHHQYTLPLSQICAIQIS